MKKFTLLTCLLFSISSFAHGDDKRPEAELKLSDHNCTSPCKITLDGSKSKASKGQTITKYIFDLGNGDTIESITPVVEFTYINFVEGNDLKKKERYKKWKKYIEWSHKKFKKSEKFETSLKVVQSDNHTSKEDKQVLHVKASDILPTIDGDDVIPPKPDQVLSDSTLLGIDMDGDGVRDDLELWVNQVTAVMDFRKALKQNLKYSRLVQQYSSDPTQVKLFMKKAASAIGCLSAQATKGYSGKEALRKLSIAEKLVSKMSSLEFNTQERMLTEMRNRKYLNEIDLMEDDSLAMCEL